MGLGLRVEDLLVAAPNGRELFRAARLEVAPGSVTVLRGPSGAGKTTALHALAGLRPVATGRICWGETDIAGLGPGARAAFRRRRLGLIFQDPNLFDELDAAGNTAVAASYAPRNERQKIRSGGTAALERLGLAADRAQKAATYSGGERQRIAVARALAGNPDALLADEPTASLDRSNADALIADLTALARNSGLTVLAISHDAAFHDAADSVIDIRDGFLSEPLGI